MRGLKLIEIVEVANRKFPFSYSEDWDNSGVQVGNLEREIKNIAFSLDANPSTILFAQQTSSELLITHHPLILQPIKTFISSDLSVETLKAAIRYDIDVMSLHTNLDAAPGGLNDYLAQLIGLNHVFVPERAMCARFGNLECLISLDALNELVKARLSIDQTTLITNDKDCLVSKVFLASGSGAGYLADAIRLEADVMITGDVKYHAAVDARRCGVSVIDAGHFGMEKHAVRLMADSFKNEFKNMGAQMVCHECHDEKDPFSL